jgi:AraC-like DNA-binding protein
VLYVRAVTLSSYFDVAQPLGLDPFQMLKEFGLSPSWLEDPEFRIPAKPVARLLEVSAERTRCQSFGIMMAEHRSFESFGPLTLLLERVATMRDVLDAIVTYRRHLSDVLDLHIERNDDDTTVRLDFAREYDGPQSIDLAIAMGYRALRGASAGKWAASSVHLVRQTPDDPRPWQRFFKIPVEFESPFNGLRCSNESLGMHIPLADETMAEHADRLLKLVPIHHDDARVSDHVKLLIARLLPTGRSTAEQVAAIMGISLRGLQRSLEQEGQTFAALQNDVRRQLALQSLTNSSQPITSIAEQVGYSTPSSFTRWFAGEFGMAPQAWRSTRRASAPH